MAPVSLFQSTNNEKLRGLCITGVSALQKVTDNDFWAVGNCSKVFSTVSCWHKIICSELLAAYALTSNKICLKLLISVFTIPKHMPIVPGHFYKCLFNVLLIKVVSFNHGMIPESDQLCFRKFIRQFFKVTI